MVAVRTAGVKPEKELLILMLAHQSLVQDLQGHAGSEGGQKRPEESPFSHLNAQKEVCEEMKEQQA